MSLNPSNYPPGVTGNEPEITGEYDYRRILVIDDIRTYEGATNVRNCADGIAMLSKGGWDEVWLDHDLGAQDTIEPVISWLVLHSFELRDMIDVALITANPVGMRWMLSNLREAGYSVTCCPGGANMPLRNLTNVRWLGATDYPE